MNKLFAVLGLLALLLALPARAADTAKQSSPWEKYSFHIGTFISSITSDLRVGGKNVALEFNVEDVLGMNTDETVFRIGGSWRFTQNRRHRVDVDWFAFHRNADRVVSRSFDIEDNDGNSLTITAGTRVESFLDIDIYRLSYSYSFLQDDRIDLAGQFGFFVMPINAGLTAEGLIDSKEAADFTAPLPTIGFRTDIALAPKWFMRLGAEVFYLQYENFTGSLLNAHAGVEYTPWQHVGIGIGFDAMRLRLEAEDEDYPAIDLRGKVEFEYAGLQLYLRIFF